MGDRATNIIRNIAGRKAEGGPKTGPSKNPYEGFYGVLWTLGYYLRKGWVIVLCSVIGLVSVYYYNHLYVMEWNAIRDGSSILVYQQMRRDLNKNIERVTSAFILHEKDIFQNVAEAKSEMLGMSPEMKKTLADKVGQVSKSDKNVGHLMGQFFGLAEQYPDLKFSAEFHYVVQALMETEKSIAAARVAYNMSVNNYLTVLETCPGNIFAFIFRYKPLPYFDANKENTEFSAMFESLKERPLDK